MSLQQLELVVDEELVLRQFAVQDAQAIYTLISRNRAHLSMFGDETSAKYPDLDSVVASITAPKNPKRLRLGIWNRERILVGSVNLTPDEVMPCAEIGYYLDATQQGKGYASRAVSRIVRFAFEDTDIRWVFGKVNPENATSIKVLERNGFHFSRHELDDYMARVDVYSKARV